MAEKTTRLEITVLLLLVIYFLFAATNINSTLGLTYAAFAIASIAFIIADSRRTIKIRRQNDSLPGSIAIGVFAHVALLVIASLVVVPTIDAVLKLLGATTPALSNSAFFNFISFGIAVPIVESVFFFVVVYDILASTFNIQISKQNLGKLSLWVLMLGIALAFMFFHLSAKGIDNVPTLAITFTMALMSLLLVTWYKSGEQAIFFHITANTSALTIPALGLISLIKLQGGKNNGKRIR